MYVVHVYTQQHEVCACNMIELCFRSAYSLVSPRLKYWRLQLHPGSLCYCSNASSRLGSGWIWNLSQEYWVWRGNIAHPGWEASPSSSHSTTHTHTHTLTLSFTPRGKLESPIHLQVCFLGGGRKETGEETHMDKKLQTESNTSSGAHQEPPEVWCGEAVILPFCFNSLSKQCGNFQVLDYEFKRT